MPIFYRTPPLRVRSKEKLLLFYFRSNVAKEFVVEEKKEDEGGGLLDDLRRELAFLVRQGHRQAPFYRSVPKPGTYISCRNKDDH